MNRIKEACPESEPMREYVAKKDVRHHKIKNLNGHRNNVVTTRGLNESVDLVTFVVLPDHLIFLAEVEAYVAEDVTGKTKFLYKGEVLYLFAIKFVGVIDLLFFLVPCLREPRDPLKVINNPIEIFSEDADVSN
jgi:hypothetical protein